MCLCVLHDLASCLWVYFRTLCLACRARPCGCGCVSCALVTCIMCAGYVYHVRWLRVSCALVTCIMCAGYAYHVRWLRVSCALVACIMCAGCVYHVRWLRVSCELVTCIMCAGYIGHDARALWCMSRVGQEPYIYRCIRCIYGIFSRGITIHMVIHGANIRIWPTLCMSCATEQCMLLGVQGMCGYVCVFVYVSSDIGHHSTTFV